VQIPYLGLIQQLLWACPNTPMILLEVPHVSLRLQLRAMSVDDVAHAAAQILWRHSYQEACFMAHSYGTFCASRICQLHRSMVHSMVCSTSKPQDSTVLILAEIMAHNCSPFCASRIALSVHPWCTSPPGSQTQSMCRQPLTSVLDVLLLLNASHDADLVCCSCSSDSCCNEKLGIYAHQI